MAGSSSGGAGSGAELLDSPWDVVIDDTSAIYVSDKQNKRVQKWLPGASNGTTVAGGGGVTGTGLNQIDGGKLRQIYSHRVDSILNLQSCMA